MVVVNLCNYMDHSAFRLGICSLTDSIPLAARLREPEAVRVTTCGRVPGRVPLSHEISLFRRVRRVIRAFQPDIIHSHLVSLHAPLQWLCSIGIGAIHVVTVHNTGMHYEDRQQWRSVVFRACEAFNIHFSGATVIAVSRAVQEVVRRFLHVNNDRIRVIYNGVSVEEFSREHCDPIPRSDLGCSDDDLVVTCVAGLRAQKGHELLLKAWRDVVVEVPNARLVLVGDGPLRARLQALVEENGLDGFVRFLGERDDVQKVLAASDVGVFASLYEGLPVAAVEMMSMGLPVVGTDVPGLREALAPPTGGVLVPPAQPTLLAEALIRLLRDEQLRSTLGQAGRRRAVELFSIERQAKEHEELYRTLLRKKRGGGHQWVLT